MNVLVTGAGGFVGSNLIERLRFAPQFNVFAYQRSVQIHLANVHYVRNLDDLISIVVENPLQMVIHLATSYEDSQAWSSNIIFPSQIIAAIEEHNDCHCYFINCDTFLSLSSDPINNYSRSKKIFYSVGNFLCQNSKDIYFVNLVLHQVFGNEKAGPKFLANTINDIKNNVPYVDLTCGLQNRFFIYIDATIELFISFLTDLGAMKIEKAFNPSFHIVSEAKITLKAFLLLVKDHFKSSTDLRFGVIDYRENEIMDIVIPNGDRTIISAGSNIDAISNLE